MGEKEAYAILKLLMGVTEDGTGQRLRHNYGEKFYRNKAVTGYPYAFTNEIAGKTGTTQNNSDAGLKTAGKGTLISLGTGVVIVFAAVGMAGASSGDSWTPVFVAALVLFLQ